MHGVVSVLDDDHYRRVEALWAELAEALGLRRTMVTPVPHFSYHVAEQYDLEPLEAVLRTFAASTPPFRVRANGLGVFTGLRPVLYLPVVRTSDLSALHHALWHETSRYAAGIVDYYRPERWLPHITLAHGDVRPDDLAAAVRAFAARDVDWEIAIDNVSLIYDTGTRQELRFRFELGR